MGFLGHRRRHVEVHPEQKWEYINLNDFKSTSWYTPFAYAYLWFSLILAIAVYGVDIFTAYQLIAFNKWTSQVELNQLIPFDISKWVFSVCIILSFVNLAYEYLRAARIMRRGSVAECFLDALAARLESIRPGSGKGWKRFLVFAALTESKKGSEYVALFTFFSFQSWIRVLICSGPRQAINALNLYSLYNLKLQIKGDNFESSLSSFFDKLKALATEEPRQTVILSGMLFTLVVWIFSFLSLLLAGLFFVFYLWGHIPRSDGGLTGFCERKVNKRLKEIVAKKINKAMAEEERKRRKAEFKAAKKNGEDRPITMKPSLPVVLGGDNMPEMPSISRADTFASFSEKPSVPSTPGSFEMNALGKRPPAGSATMATSASQYSSNASLIGGAAEMGMGGRASPTPTVPSLPPYPPSRTATGTLNRSFGPGIQPQRMPSNGSSLRAGYTDSPATYSSETMPSLPPRILSPAGLPNQYRGSPGPNGPRDRWPGQPGDGRPMFDEYGVGRASPAPTMTSYHSGPRSPPPVMGPDGYPMRSATGPMPPRGMGPNGYGPPGRSATAPMPPQRVGPDGYPIRSATTTPGVGANGYPGRDGPDPIPPPGMGTGEYPDRSDTSTPRLGPDGFASLGAAAPMPPQGMGPDAYPDRNDTSTPRLGPDGFASLGGAAPIAPQVTEPDEYPPRSDTSTPKLGPDGFASLSATTPMSPQQTGPGGYPVRSATNPIPARDSPPRFPPPRAMTSPMQPSHQPTGSNSSLSSMPPGPPQPFHQPTSSIGSQRSVRSGLNQPYHQPSASNSSLRNMVRADEPEPLQQQEPSLPTLLTLPALPTGPPQLPPLPRISTPSPENGSDDFEFASRPNPMTAVRPTGGLPSSPSPRSGYGGRERDGARDRDRHQNGNGWNEDLERGPRY